MADKTTGGKVGDGGEVGQDELCHLQGEVGHCAGVYIHWSSTTGVIHWKYDIVQELFTGVLADGSTQGKV